MEAPMGKAIACDDSIVWRPEIKIEIIYFRVYQNICHTPKIKTCKHPPAGIGEYLTNGEFTSQTNWLVFI